MKVRELIEKLASYNQDADVEVIAHNRTWDYSITFGGGEGVSKENCESVSFYVDPLNKKEIRHPEI